MKAMAARTKTQNTQSTFIRKVFIMLLSSLLVMTTCSCQAYGTVVIEDDATPMAATGEGTTPGEDLSDADDVNGNESSDPSASDVSEIPELNKETFNEDDGTSGEDVSGQTEDAASSLPDIQAGALEAAGYVTRNAMDAADEVDQAAGGLLAGGDGSQANKAEGAVTDPLDNTASTWEELTAALTAGHSVQLAADIVVDDAATAFLQGASPVIVVPAGQAVTLDLNGYGIYAERSQEALFSLAPRADFTITDSQSKDAPIEPVKVADELLPPSTAADQAGKTGTWDAASRMLTYYVTRSKTNGSTGTTSEVRETWTLTVPDATSAAGLYAVADGVAVDRLVENAHRGTLCIEGGTFENHSGGAVFAKGEWADPATVIMTGGRIVGCSAAKGAGILLDQWVDLELGGTALIMNNHATMEAGAISVGWKNNATIGGHALLLGNTTDQYGGALRVTADSAVALKGNAVFAGNSAGQNGGVVEYNSGVNLTVRDHVVLAANRAENGTGGAISVGDNNGGKLVVSDNVVIAGNTAKTNGGGISINQAALSHELAITGDVMVTNNRTLENSSYHFDRMMGGAGLAIGGRASIDGIQVTSNLSADAGGGIFVLKGADVTLRNEGYVRKNIIAANKTLNSEGGGLCAFNGANTTIYSAYVTNNACATEFDYGGGGIFNANEAKMHVFYPLITGNVAGAMGGGVAGCKTSEVITADAAIFGNSALEQWCCDQHGNSGANQWQPEAKGQGDEKWIKMLAAIDGVSYPNDPEHWYYPFSHEQYTIPNLNGGAAKGLSSDFYVGHESTVYSTMLGGGTANWTGYMAIDTTGVMSTLVYDEGPENLRRACGLLSGNGELLKKDGVPDPAYATPLIGANGQVVTMYGAPIYQIKQFPVENPDNEKPKAMARSNSMMGLTAHPSAADKSKAAARATVYVTGNTSHMNGGGVANNGDLTVGSNPYPKPDEPTPDDGKPEPIRGELVLAKDAAAVPDDFAGSLTAVFTVTGYASEGAFLDGANPIYNNVVAFTFDVTHTAAQTARLTDLPEGFYRVEEKSFALDNFDDDTTAANHTTFEISAADAHGDSPIVTVDAQFTNKYSPEGGLGSGVVNAYGPGADGFTWSPLRAGDRIRMTEGE